MNLFETSDILASIGEFLAEDIGRGDITTQACVPEDVRGFGKFLAKEDIVICGLPVAEAVFFQLDEESPEIETTINEGDEVEVGNDFCDFERLRRCAFDGRACCAQFAAEIVGHCDVDAPICQSNRRHERADR